MKRHSLPLPVNAFIPQPQLLNRRFVSLGGTEKVVHLAEESSESYAELGVHCNYPTRTRSATRQLGPDGCQIGPVTLVRCGADSGGTPRLSDQLASQMIIILTVVSKIPATSIGTRLLLDRGSDAASC
jgi:hypothetical protein